MWMLLPMQLNQQYMLNRKELLLYQATRSRHASCVIEVTHDNDMLHRSIQSIQS